MRPARMHSGAGSRHERKSRASSHGRGRRRSAPRLPPLLVAAERVAATVAQGVHGRRRVGTGRQLLAVPSVRRRRRRRTRSTGGNPANPTAPSSARPSGRRRRPSACGATAAPACAGARPRGLPRSSSGPSCCCWRLPPAAARRRTGPADRGGRARVLRPRGAGRRSARALPAHGGRRCLPEAVLPRHARAVLIGDFLAPLAAIQVQRSRAWPRCRCAAPGAGARSGRGAAAVRPGALPRPGRRGRYGGPAVEGVRDQYAEALASAAGGAGGDLCRRRLRLCRAPHRPCARERRCWRLWHGAWIAGGRAGA